MNEFPMHKMNSSDEDILDISHSGGSGNAGLTSDGAINTSEGRPRDGVFGGTPCDANFVHCPTKNNFSKCVLLAELIGSLKIGDFWGVVQLICRPTMTE